SKEFKQNIGIELIYDYPSLAELSEYFASNITEEKYEGSSSFNIDDIINKTLNEVLGRNEFFNDKDTFYSIGLDSVKLVTFVEKVNKIFNLSLGVETIFDFPTIGEFKENIINNSNEYDKDLSNEESFTEQGEKIAVIGMSGKLGENENLNEYWETILKGKSTIKKIHREGWNVNDTYSVASLIPNIAKFDCEFFNISPREALRMDPQQRVLMEEVYKALEDSGYSKKKLERKKVGVFIGARASDYINKNVFKEHGIESQMFLGSDMGIMAGRIAYFYDLKGPCLTVDTACSSSLTALHLACESIRRKESSMAIVGSVFLMTDSDFLVEAAKTGILSESGECRTFDENADGTILGEGTGAVILKPLKDAIKDNDNIHAVICGTAMNQDGKTNGITAPSAVSQEELIKSSLKNANTKAEDIGYIEVHGTGTKLGDPIEINALTKTFRKETDKKEFCYIGSHKPCVGHTIALSGLAGVFKTISILEKSKIPPVCKFNELNHHINLKDSPFVINRESVNWLHENNKKHKAAVSSFGFSGTNCSVILEEWKNENDVISKEKNYVFPISGRTEKALNRKISDLKEFLINNKDAQIGSIARVLQEGRDHFTFRKAFIANSVENLINQIEGNSSYNLFDIDEEIKSLKERYEKGEDINWSFDNKNKLISMPSYPFEGEDYWLSTNLENKEVKNEDETFKKRVFKDDVFIRDHFIQGKNVMPGAGQIVYTLEFLKKKFKNDNLEIDNLNLFRPIVVNSDYTDFTFDLDEDLKKVEIKSHNGEVMTRAEVNLNTTYESYNNYINNENILSIDAKTIRKKDFYDNLTLKKNAIYGDTLQVVEEIKWDKDYAYGTLNYSESAFKETEKIISILDGALQCLLVFYMDNDNMAVPFSFEKVKLLKEFTSEVKVQIERTDKDEYNLSIMNFKGEICAILKGITLKVLDKKFNLDLFVPKWKRIEAPKLDDTNLINKNILIIYSKDGVEVKNKLEELHKMNYVNSLIIDENVIQNINSFRNVDEIYYISKISKKEVDINSLRELEEAEILSLEPLYKIVKGMDDSFKERQLKFTVITNNSYGTDVSLCTNPYSALMFGFVKSMSKEYYNWNISLFDLNYNALLENDFEDVKYTACDGFNNGEYLISDGKIYSQELAVLEKPDIKINPYKNNGVYVVVGGTGGIGLEYCKHLALTAHAKIVVIGRREYDNEIKEKLRIIEDLGGEFVYYSLNIADENSLSSMISEVKRRWGAINGVIHSALVLRDMEIKKMDERDLYDVLDPKVKGTWNLYNSFKNENLDFMLVFSSCQSFVGNPSQSNYAAASSFQDSFVSFIALNSSFPVKLINWGYWGSVGVVSNEKYNKIMKMQGYTSIEINDGMKVIDTILSSFVDRVVAIKAEDEVYKAMGVNKKITINTNLKTALPISDENLLLNIISRDKDEEIIEFLKDLDILQNTAKSKLMDILDSGDIKKSKRFERLLTELLGMMSRSKERNLISFKDFNISNPKLEGFNKLISACLENYKEIINGQVLATDIMFPGGKSSLVEPIYKDNPLSDYCIEVISRMIDNIISTWKRDGNKEKIKIIEIGSGTGSTAEKVCKCLSKFLKVEYCYTDISRSFLNYGSRKFNDKYDFIEYKILDIEKDPLSQGFNQGDFDIVIATNVLHATTNISKVLRNVKSLMKANGLVLINEITKKQDYLTMTFGLLDGWWKYEDKTYREAGSPILSEENWRKLLYKEGFKDTKFIGLPVDSKDIWSQHVIVSKNNECIEVYKLERTSQISNNMNIESKEVKLEVKQDNINEIILEKVCSIVEKCLGLRHEQMDIHKPFVDMGSDSIISMEIITDINKELNLKLK
nr:SDR family NAD(P)-dependent oxidoreductase [Clostridium sp.]